MKIRVQLKLDEDRPEPVAGKVHPTDVFVVALRASATGRLGEDTITAIIVETGAVTETERTDT